MRLRDKVQLKNIPINKIKTDTVPPDKELQISLLEAEQKYPIKIRPIDNPDYDYEVVNGRQRIDALQKTGQTHVQALVESMGDQEYHIQALIGNAGRPNEVDEGRHIIQLEEMGFTGEQIAKLTRYSTSTVSQRKRLWEKLHPQLREKVQQGLMKASAALEATKVPLDVQAELISNGNKITFKEVFEEVRSWQAQQLDLFSDDLPNEVKPGLFLTSQQVEDLLSGESLEVNWMDYTFIIKRDLE